MILHLIRHGQTDWNAVRRVQGQTDSQLDDTGKLQASDLGQDLVDIDFKRAYVSTSVRTRQTADLLLKDRDIPTVFSDDLREMRLGRWETHMWPDIERDEPETVSHYQAFDDRFSVAGAESLKEMQQRGIDAIERVIAAEREAGSPADTHIVIVSHGFLLRAILAHYLGLPLQAFAGSEGLPNCAHNIVVVRDDARHVTTIAGEPANDSLWRDIIATSAN